MEPGEADGAQEPGIQRCVGRDGLLTNPDWFDDDVLERRVLRQTVGASDRLPQAISVPRMRQVVVVESGLDGWIRRREGEFTSAQRLLNVRIDGEAWLALFDRPVGGVAGGSTTPSRRVQLWNVLDDAMPSSTARHHVP